MSTQVRAGPPGQPPSAGQAATVEQPPVPLPDERRPWWVHGPVPPQVLLVTRIVVLATLRDVLRCDRVVLATCSLQSRAPLPTSCTPPCGCPLPSSEYRPHVLFWGMHDTWSGGSDGTNRSTPTLSIPSGFLVVSENPNRSSCTFTRPASPRQSFLNIRWAGTSTRGTRCTWAAPRPGRLLRTGTLRMERRGEGRVLPPVAVQATPRYGLTQWNVPYSLRSHCAHGPVTWPRSLRNVSSPVPHVDGPVRNAHVWGPPRRRQVPGTLPEPCGDGGTCTYDCVHVFVASACLKNSDQCVRNLSAILLLSGPPSRRGCVLP
jgi:hypothetical protein